MRWRPDPLDRGAWSTAGGVFAAVGAAAAIAWLGLTELSSSHEPLWPVYAFSALAVMGLYVMMASLLGLWPWGRGRTTIRASGPSGIADHTNMNRLLRRLFHEHRGRRSLSNEEHLMLTTEPPPFDEDEPVSEGAVVRVGVEHDPIRWNDIAKRPHVGEEPIPLEPWLEDRIGAYAEIARQRAVRKDRWFFGALNAWDVRNTHELLTKVAPELVDSYRGDPPGHPPGQEGAYYDRQLAWLKQTLRELREGIGDTSELVDGDGHGAAGPLAVLYKEGERLRASILWSAASIPGDLIQGAAVQRQVERERLARDWDARVSRALSDDVRMEWAAASTLPEAHPTRSLIEHTSTIAGVRGHLAAKLACLKAIIGRLEPAPTSGIAVEVVTAESIEPELSAFVPWAGRMLQGDVEQEPVTDWAEKVGISLRARGPEGEEDMFLAEGHGLGARAELEAKVARLQNHILPRVRGGERTRPTVGDT
jgi:hypothetical protein